MRKSILFLIIGLIIAAIPAFAEVSFLDFGDLTVDEGSNLIYNLPLNTTDLNGTLQCSVALNPSPNGQYSVVASQNNCTFYFMPTYDDAGVYMATFNVSDADSNDSKTVNIVVNNVNRAPVFTSSPITQTFVNEAYTYDVNANDPDGDVLIYWLDTAPEGMVINSTSGLISWLPTQTGTFSVVVKVSDGIATVNQTFTLSVVEKKYLSLERAKVSVDGDSETLSDGETFEAKPGSTLDFSFKIKNVHPDKLDIEDVYVEVYIRGIDGEDEDDLFEESDEVDIDYGDYETLEVSFDLPLLVKDDKYEVNVYIYGTDESNLDISEERNYTLKIDKERYEIYTKNFEIFPQKITCSGTAELVGRIYNIGRNDVDLRISVTNEELGLNYQKTVTLDSNPFDDENDYYLDVPIQVDSAKEDKDYRII